MQDLPVGKESRGLLLWMRSIFYTYWCSDWIVKARHVKVVPTRKGSTYISTEVYELDILLIVSFKREFKWKLETIETRDFLALLCWPYSWICSSHATPKRVEDLLPYIAKWGMKISNLIRTSRNSMVICNKKKTRVWNWNDGNR